MDDQTSGNSAKVTIIIPCYNDDVYVGEAIESALRQTYEPTEVIVVNDGSSDRSAEVIKTYDDQITWVDQQNQGAPAARNRGLSLATGAFVKFLDAADALADECLETQVRQTRERCDGREIIFGDIAEMNEAGEVQYRTSYGKERSPSKLSIPGLLGPYIQTPAPLHRTEALEAVGGFDEESLQAQEYDLHIKLWANGVDFTYGECLCCFVRQHDAPSRIGNKTLLAEHPMRVYRAVERRMDWVKKRLGRRCRTAYLGHLRGTCGGRGGDCCDGDTGTKHAGISNGQKPCTRRPRGKDRPRTDA